MSTVAVLFALVASFCTGPFDLHGQPSINAHHPGVGIQCWLFSRIRVPDLPGKPGQLQLDEIAVFKLCYEFKDRVIESLASATNNAYLVSLSPRVFHRLCLFNSLAQFVLDSLQNVCNPCSLLRFPFPLPMYNTSCNVLLISFFLLLNPSNHPDISAQFASNTTRSAEALQDTTKALDNIVLQSSSHDRESKIQGNDNKGPWWRAYATLAQVL